LAAPLALPGVAPDAHHRLAAARGTSAPARPDGACDPARERLPPRVARRRSRDLGQSRHDASRAAVRRPQAPPRAPPRDHARYRRARAGRGRFLARELPPLESDGRSPLDAARKLVPQIRAAADETHATRELPRPLFEAMADAG